MCELKLSFMIYIDLFFTINLNLSCFPPRSSFFLAIGQVCLDRSLTYLLAFSLDHVDNLDVGRDYSPPYLSPEHLIFGEKQPTREYEFEGYFFPYDQSSELFQAHIRALDSY